MTRQSDIAAIAIGRNEGDRLVRCLASLVSVAGRVVYVDSGSTDGSLNAAREAGAEVVMLDTSVPFTAARARNAGLDHLAKNARPAFVQFVDGDCELDPDWLPKARRFLDSHPSVAVACGRRRERFPDATIWNQLIDYEWDTPVGEARACGGDALMRWQPLQDLGGYNPRLIAGEEPELCVRLRAAGWKIWRLDAEMTLHDAAMTRFSQWWKRAARAGHAWAEGAALHGTPPERHAVAPTRRALIWGLVLPLVALLPAPWWPWSLLILTAYPLQILRLSRKMGFLRACFLTLGRFPEAQGVLTYVFNRFRGRRSGLIEYK